MSPNPDSILDSVKKCLGLDSSDTTFDLDVTLIINSTMVALNQLGVGPPAGFQITDNTTLWTDYVQRNDLLGMVKSYMFMYVKLMFDTPDSRFGLPAMTKMLDELVWRINVQAEATEAAASVWWILDGLSDFPAGAQPGDWGFDSTTKDLYVNGSETLAGYWYDLTGLSDFPSDAQLGDLGYDTSGNVWRKTA